MAISVTGLVGVGAGVANAANVVRTPDVACTQTHFMALNADVASYTPSFVKTTSAALAALAESPLELCTVSGAGLSLLPLVPDLPGSPDVHKLLDCRPSGALGGIGGDTRPSRGHHRRLPARSLLRRSSGNEGSSRKDPGPRWVPPLGAERSRWRAAPLDFFSDRGPCTGPGLSTMTFQCRGLSKLRSSSGRGANSNIGWSREHSATSVAAPSNCSAFAR